MDSNKSNMINFKENTIIISEGIVSNEMYKIISGKAAMYKNYGKEDEYLIGIISNNSCFGDISMLTQTPNPCTVVTISDTLVMRIKLENFDDFIRTNTKNVIEIMTNMAKQNLMLQKNIEMLFDEITDNIKENKRVDDLRKRFTAARVANISGINFLP